MTTGQAAEGERAGTRQQTAEWAGRDHEFNDVRRAVTGKPASKFIAMQKQGWSDRQEPPAPVPAQGPRGLQRTRPGHYQQSGCPLVRLEDQRLQHAPKPHREGLASGLAPGRQGGTAWRRTTAGVEGIGSPASLERGPGEAIGRTAASRAQSAWAGPGPYPRSLARPSKLPRSGRRPRPRSRANRPRAPRPAGAGRTAAGPSHQHDPK